MRYQQLTEGLRYQIALLCEDKVSQAEIGRRLGVSQSTVSRELRRNRSVDGYLPAVAQKLSDKRRKAAGKRLMHEDTVFFVEEALNGLWSPEQISAIGNTIGRPVSQEWIYSTWPPIKPSAESCTNPSGRVSAAIAKATVKNEVRYLTPSPSSNGQRWLMNAAELGTGKPTLFWVSEAPAPSFRWPSVKAVFI